MKRTLTTTVLVVTLLFGGVLSAAAQAEQEPPSIEDVDVDDLPTISMVVAPPLDAPGDYSASEDWIVTENGEALEVVVEALATDRASVALVIDTSQSMSGDAISAAKVAAVDLINELSDETSVAVVGFGANPVVASDFTQDKSVAIDAVGTLFASGETALYDAITAAVALFSGQPGRQTIVVLSDGADTVSTATQEDAVDELDDWDGKLFAVQLVTGETAEGPLEALASASDGQLVTVDSTGGLSATFENIGSQLGNFYRLTFETEGPGGVTRIGVATAAGSATTEYLLRLPSTIVPASTSAVTTTTVGFVPRIIEGAEVTSSRLATPKIFKLALGMLFIGMVGILIPFVRSDGSTSAKTPTRSFRSRRQRVLSGVTGSLVDFADRGGAGSGLAKAIERAGLKIRSGEWVVLTLSAMMVSMFVGVALLGSGALGIALAVFTGVVSWQAINTLGARRRKAFEGQLPEMLQLLASTIRTGYAPIQASELVSREMEMPASEELGRVVAEARLGRSFTQALRSMAERLDSIDMRWVSDAIEINQEVGGDISELIDQVAETIRDRVSVKRLVQSLSAEGRASAWILVLLPFGVGGLIALTNPGYMTPLFTTFIGRLMMLGAVISMIIGSLVIRRMVDLKY